ncbi:MAG: hypothetical protein WAU53_04910 [Rhodoplanes sp.]
MRCAVVHPPLLKERIYEPDTDPDNGDNEYADHDIGDPAVALIFVVIVARSVAGHSLRRLPDVDAQP